MKVKHSVTVFTLTSGVQIEGIHWLLISADLTNESSTAANEAGGHVTSAEPHCGDQGGDQLPGVELLQVRDAVHLSPRVKIVPGPDNLRQRHLDPLLCRPWTSGQVGGEVDQLLAEAMGLIQYWS